MRPVNAANGQTGGGGEFRRRRRVTEIGRYGGRMAVRAARPCPVQRTQRRLEDTVEAAKFSLIPEAG